MFAVNRNFYYFGIFFLGLQFCLNIFHSILYLQNGIQTRYLESFSVWFLVLQVIAFIGLLFLLRYYLHKRYWIPLIAALFYTMAILFYAIVFYFMVTEQRLEGRYNSAYNMLLTTSLAYGASLFISPSRKRTWLRAAGIFLFILSTALTVFFIWILSSHDFEMKRVLNKIHDGVVLLVSLVPIPFILNFRNELSELQNLEKDISPTKVAKFSFAIILIIALIPTIQLTNDSIGDIFQKNEPSEQARKIAEPFEARTFVNEDGKSLPYRLMKPMNYDPRKKYSLAVCLHHGGGNGTENVIQIETSQWAQTLADSTNREKYPAFIFVPQCPPGSSFGGIPNYPEMSDLVFEAIAELEEEFNIDEKRRYVMGVSLGGFGSWHFIGTQPKMFAAAIPVCGGGNPDRAKNMVDIPIWAFHGEEDNNVPVDLSRAMINGIRKAGGNPKYSEFKNIGHNIWDTVNETPGKLEWLFAQKQN